MLSDPIVALATPPGRSALAVIRLSGRGSFEVAARVISRFRTAPPREARLASFRDGDSVLIDRGLYLVFPGPHSETGEDIVEFQCHGGHVVPARLLAAIEAAGARPAFAGEFTRRAVLNGKMDLLQAEGLGDLVDAGSGAQARAAIGQMEGGLSRRITALRSELVDFLAMLAYELDFPEEDDGPIPRAQLEAKRAAIVTEISRLLATAPLAERVRVGALVVLAGPPNAGKSSLFNSLLGTERALVTELPGTTRDAIEARVEVLGWPVRLVDTAGLGETSDRIDALGQAMSARYLEAADLILYCDDGSSSQVPPPGHSDRMIRLSTKADLPSSRERDLRISAMTGQGIDQLRRTLAERLFVSEAALADLEPALTRDRHRVALSAACDALGEAAPQLAPGGDAVLAAHHVQYAVRALDSLMGAVDIEEILERVFASFCVGK